MISWGNLKESNIQSQLMVSLAEQMMLIIVSSLFTCKMRRLDFVSRFQWVSPCSSLELACFPSRGCLWSLGTSAYTPKQKVQVRTGH